MTAIPAGPARGAALVSALVVLGTAVLTGCSEDPDAGTNGVGKLPAEEIQSRTRAAAESATAVHLSGTVVTSGRTYSLDMRLTSDGGSGEVTDEGTTFHLLRIGEQLFLKAGAEFWHPEHAEGDDSEDTAAADKLDGKYVKVPQGDPSYKRFSGFTDKDVLLDGVLNLHGTLETDGHHEESGTRTIRIAGDDGSGGTLDVSLQGRPYPLRLVRAGSAGTLRFTDWGRDFKLEEPKEDETVDYGKALPAS
ncbi:hypothetical protein [Streptomyces blattellae]|uniref:hypothetical protein n=1 Tax=Streptomyces blattellae TaxID=2569855 RepID=UPI0012B80347|nr:hypothetical protein [Streptomyces blattellae]